MTETHRPIEDQNPKPVFRFLRITVVVQSSRKEPFIRNVSLWNPIRALEMALQDIRKQNPGIQLNNCLISIFPIDTTDPETIPFDPEHPED